MQSFILGMKTYKTVNVNDNTKNSWLLVVIILIASVVIVITLMCIIRHKCIGKWLADGHDLGDVNVKRLFSWCHPSSLKRVSYVLAMGS